MENTQYRVFSQNKPYAARIQINQTKHHANANASNYKIHNLDEQPNSFSLIR